MEHELLTLHVHPSLSPSVCGIRVARSLVFCVEFCGSLLVFSFVFFYLLTYHLVCNWSNTTGATSGTETA